MGAGIEVPPTGLRGSASLLCKHRRDQNGEHVAESVRGRWAQGRNGAMTTPRPIVCGSETRRIVARCCLSFRTKPLGLDSPTRGPPMQPAPDVTWSKLALVQLPVRMRRTLGFFRKVTGLTAVT